MAVWRRYFNLKEGTISGTRTSIEETSSSENKAKKETLKRHQLKRVSRGSFGLKPILGVDAKNGG